jgi:hypothetical protein
LEGHKDKELVLRLKGNHHPLTGTAAARQNPNNRGSPSGAIAVNHLAAAPFPRSLPMPNAQLKTVIEAAWDARDGLTPATKGEVREAVETALNMLDNGTWGKTCRRLGCAPMGQESRVAVVSLE